ncbi:Cof-type HAD-IIB family hydrolase [uncultured Sphingomonas sp.]|uniref:Cof-type HAD-IIB family hydrolase n=1 Tax=uncultured Sphingomonas sp. TaxID=158754 RepID=UPI0025E3A137|nr:Cof-type HAD-IIB family hydrolase [uncultured Sphingomonas sp.]
MTLRLVISDVDGTLVDHDKNLAPETVAAVRRLEARGIGFSLISARPPSGIAHLIDALRPNTAVGAFNGGTILDPDGTVVERHLLPRDVVEGSFALAEGTGAEPWLFADGAWHAPNRDNPHVPREILSSGVQPVIGRDMTALFDRADKLSWVSDDYPLLEKLQNAMRDRLGDQATIALSQPYFLDLTHANANKGAGIATLARMAGVDLADVAVLGDQHNDLPMFARAGLSIAMGQAPDAVKAAATYVSTSNDAHGVAHAIDTILLPMVEAQA